LKQLNAPSDILVVNMGENGFSRYHSDLQLPAGGSIAAAVKEVADMLKTKEIIIEYEI